MTAVANNRITDLGGVLEILSDPVLAGVWREFQPPAILKRIVHDTENKRRPYCVEFYHEGHICSVQCRLSEATSFQKLAARAYAHLGFMLRHPCDEHGNSRVGQLGRMLWGREVKLAIDAGARSEEK